MQAEIDKDKHQALTTLNEGLAELCADKLTEVLINFEDGVCDYLELIPVLQEVARVDWFYYFDDNGAGGQPHAALRGKSSFRSWALKAVENINENARFESTSIIHQVLKSNNTTLIRETLELLKTQNKTADKSLIPILEKIARKDVYKKYSYIGGFETDCQLGELARAVVQMIVEATANPDSHDKPTNVTNGKCTVCSSLPDDITVNTGRDEYFPNAFSQLIGMDNNYRAEFRCCPQCRTYFNWIDMTQMYGSGNNDEERLVRLSVDRSLLLDKLFTIDSNNRQTPMEIDEYLRLLPPEFLVPALRIHLHRNREFITPFVPNLLRLLAKNNDTLLWELLQGYVSDGPERAKEMLNEIQLIDDHGSMRLRQISDYCLNLTKGK